MPCSTTSQTSMPPLRSVSAHGLQTSQDIRPARYRQQSYADRRNSDDVAASSLLNRVGSSSSMLDTRGCNGILLSARGILDTTSSSILTPPTALHAPAPRSNLALPSPAASTLSRQPSFTAAPGLMKASARATSASLDSQPVKQPAITSPFAFQHQHDSPAPSMCGLGSRRKERMALAASPPTSTLQSASPAAMHGASGDAAQPHQPLRSSPSAFQLGGMPVGQTEAAVVKEAAAISHSQIMLLPPPAWASQSDQQAFKAPARSQSSASCSTGLSCQTDSLRLLPGDLRRT